MDEKQRTPLMLAAEVGLDSCIKILLSYGAAMHIADTSGNNAFHHACRAGSPASTLRLLLGYSSRVTSQQQRALLLLKNNQGQTVLHVASECGHAHLVEIFLSTCGASLLTKMLQMQDARSQTPLLTAIAAGSTDVVMCILMWRGNHQNPGRQWQSIRSNKIGGSRLDTSSSTCPLIWAISKGSSDMVHLLLEFNGASLLTATSCSYNLLGALHATVHSNHYDRVEIIRILVQAGADPCADVSQELAGAGESTSVSTAACKGDIEALHVMLDTFEQVKRTNGIARRKDPKLRRQPNSYFTALESKENKLYSAALCDALVKTLFIGWRSPSDDSSQCCLRSAVALVKKGANLSDAGFERLKQSIAARKLKPPVEFSEEAGWFRFEATYIQYGDLNSDTFSKSLTTFDRSALQFWSKALCEMPWMKTEVNTIHCSWMKGELLASDNSAENVDNVALIAGDTRFLVHSAIVSAKSAKLDAAIRFALMNKSTNAPNCGAPVEVRIELSAKICKLLLQHIYHGSIISGWSSDFAECCRELLELSLVAEEYLCPSLLNECEMRLCSANPFRCYCWSCCTVVKIVETSSSSQNMPTAACLYRADGPSRLLSAETVLDALAVSQQLGEFRRNDDLLKFRLLATAPVDSVFSDHAVWQNFIANNSCLTTPFGGVKYASVQFLLKNLCAVLNSVSYACHIEGLFQTFRDSKPPEQHAHYEAQMMLLQVCLEELNVSVLNKSKGYPATNRFE